MCAEISVLAVISASFAFWFATMDAILEALMDSVGLDQTVQMHSLI